jgi:hypothetical protein
MNRMFGRRVSDGGCSAGALAAQAGPAMAATIRIIRAIPTRAAAARDRFESI